MTISKAATDRAAVNINNPDNFQISGGTISGTGSEFFIASFNAASVELAFNGATDVPVGTITSTVSNSWW